MGEIISCMRRQALLARTSALIGVSLLADPGVVLELKFGSWVLLQPGHINAYAQAVIQTMREDEHERGCLAEERVLKGDLAYESSMPRLAGDEERFVLLARHQTLVERAFPSPAGRKRVAQRFIAGFPGAERTSPVRDERTGSDFAWFLSPLRGLGRLVCRCPSDESLGYVRPSLTDFRSGASHRIHRGRGRANLSRLHEQRPRG